MPVEVCHCIKGGVGWGQVTSCMLVRCGHSLLIKSALEESCWEAGCEEEDVAGQHCMHHISVRFT